MENNNSNSNNERSQISGVLYQLLCLATATTKPLIYEFIESYTQGTQAVPCADGSREASMQDADRANNQNLNALNPEQKKYIFRVLEIWVEETNKIQAIESLHLHICHKTTCRNLEAADESKQARIHASDTLTRAGLEGIAATAKAELNQDTNAMARLFGLKTKLFGEDEDA